MEVEIDDFLLFPILYLNYDPIIKVTKTDDLSKLLPYQRQITRLNIEVYSFIGSLDDFHNLKEVKLPKEALNEMTYVRTIY